MIILFAAAEVIFENNRSRDLVDKGLVLTGFLLQAAFEHRLMGQHRGETLIVILYRNIGYCLAPTVDKLLNARQVLAGLTIGLTGFTDDDALYLLLGQISLQPIKKL